jgi:hypothetical protein
MVANKFYVRILVAKPLGKRSHGRLGRRWRIILRQILETWVVR